MHESLIDIISCRREKFFQMRPGFIQPVGTYKQRGQGLARIDRIRTDVYPDLGCLKRRHGLARLKRDFSCALCHSRVPRRFRQLEIGADSDFLVATLSCCFGQQKIEQHG